MAIAEVYQLYIGQQQEPGDKIANPEIQSPENVCRNSNADTAHASFNSNDCYLRLE